MRNEINAYYGKVNNLDIQLLSSSGGIFSVLAKCILDNGGVVWGAGFDGNVVKHICITDEKDIYKIRRSKYVQSDIGVAYREILNQLKSGQKVLFSGTPCQCNALYIFLKNKVDVQNLIFLELVCHGVPSPMVWKKYLEILSSEKNKNTSEIEKIEFKYKDGNKYLWNHPGFVVKWNDKEYVDFSNNTWYENSFLGNMNVRPSCYNCAFKRFNTNSDIIIGDFWGCDKIAPDDFDTNGVSIIFTLTMKGQRLFEECADKLLVKETSVNNLTKYNARILYSTEPSPKRNKFWSQYFLLNSKGACSRDYELLVNECLKVSFKDKLYRKVKHMVNKLWKS